MTSCDAEKEAKKPNHTVKVSQHPIEKAKKINYQENEDNLTINFIYTTGEEEINKTKSRRL